MWNLNSASSPRGQTDENGAFIIVNVPTGRYGVLVNDQSKWGAVNTSAGAELIISVTAGRITDIGTGLVTW
jgi:hypothetical protein